MDFKEHYDKLKIELEKMSPIDIYLLWQLAQEIELNPDPFDKLFDEDEYLQKRIDKKLAEDICKNIHHFIGHIYCSEDANVTVEDFFGDEAKLMFVIYSDHGSVTFLFSTNLNFKLNVKTEAQVDPYTNIVVWFTEADTLQTLFTQMNETFKNFFNEEVDKQF